MLKWLKLRKKGGARAGCTRSESGTDFATFYVLPLVTFLGEFRFAYETYHTCILFFRRIRTRIFEPWG